MDNYIPQVGDIIFQDSNKVGARIVKYLMRSPTIWHDIYRVITKTIVPASYYHPVVVISPELGETAEQQKVVQYDDIEDDLKYSRLLIVRRKEHVTEMQKLMLVKFVIKELGQPWGTINVFGKLFTWLTGIKQFGRYIKRKNEEVSALRIARWYYKVFGETFGEADYRDNTTQTMVQYCLSHPNKYEVVYKKG